MKKVLRVFVLLVVLLGAISVIGKSLKTRSVSPDDVTEETIRNASNKFNLTLPITADKDTRLDSTFVGPGKRWTFVYTLVNTSASEITATKLQEAMAEQVTNGVCSAQETRVFVEHGVQIVLKYRDKDGVVIGDIVVNAGSCPGNGA